MLTCFFLYTCDKLFQHLLRDNTLILCRNALSVRPFVSRSLYYGSTSLNYVSLIGQEGAISYQVCLGAELDGPLRVILRKACHIAAVF